MRWCRSLWGSWLLFRPSIWGSRLPPWLSDHWLITHSWLIKIVRFCLFNTGRRNTLPSTNLRLVKVRLMGWGLPSFALSRLGGSLGRSCVFYGAIWGNLIGQRALMNGIFPVRRGAFHQGLWPFLLRLLISWDRSLRRRRVILVVVPFLLAVKHWLILIVPSFGSLISVIWHFTLIK